MTDDAGPLLAGPLLAGHGLVRRYSVGAARGRAKSALTAVDDVTIEVAPGETVGVVGESGSGKSTLARLLLRLEPPTHGRVEFEGTDVTDLRGAELRRLRRRLRAVFQDVKGALNPKLTVAQLLGEQMRLHWDLGRSDALERSAELLDTVGLGAPVLQRYPYELSGGQAQRVGIAMALSADPAVVVLDEPVSSLDVSTQAQIINLLERIQRDTGVSYLVIAHDLYVVHHVSHRIVVMYLGAVVEQGPADRVLDDPGHPYTRALLAAIPDPRRPPSEYVLPGEVPSPLDIPSGCRFHTRCPEVMDMCRTVVPRAWPVPGGGTATCHLLDPDVSSADPAPPVPVTSPSRDRRSQPEREDPERP
ncbi:MAG: ABC transporter ATP-binding protein [Ilumatobacteraceae bacterium]